MNHRLSASADRNAGGKLTDESETDWALLRIDRSLGDEIGTVGARRLSEYSASQAMLVRLFQAGYSWDTGSNLSGDLDCGIAELDGGRLIRHDCDTTRGDSGSPLMVRDGNSYFIVATDSAFDIVPYEPATYVATRADEWVGLLADLSPVRPASRFQLRRRSRAELRLARRCGLAHTKTGRRSLSGLSRLLVSIARLCVGDKRFQ